MNDNDVRSCVQGRFDARGHWFFASSLPEARGVTWSPYWSSPLIAALDLPHILNSGSRLPGLLHQDQCREPAAGFGGLEQVQAVGGGGVVQRG